MTVLFSADAARLAAEVRRALENGATTVTLDLADVACIEARGLRAVAAALDAARAAGATLHLDGARPSVHKALHVARLV